MKKITEFKVAPGYMLFIQKQDGRYFLQWSHVSDVCGTKHWPQGSDKIPLPVASRNHAILFVSMFASMFGIIAMEDLSKEYPKMELVIRFGQRRMS